MKNINFERYSSQKQTELSPLKKDFLTFVKPGDSFLDIGGATGSYLDLVNRIVPIKGTVLETDRDCVEYGRKKYPHINFVEGKFPPGTGSDFVSLWALFPHFENWKEILISMAGCALKGMMFSSILCIDGRTIADKDVSYFYYFNTGKRVAQVIHNVYELVNFLCLQEIKAKKIVCVGTSIIEERFQNKATGPHHAVLKDAMHVFRAMTPFQLYNADWLIELWPTAANPKRMGGAGISGLKIEGYNFYLPDIDIILDNEMILYARDNNWTYRIPDDKFE